MAEWLATQPSATPAELVKLHEFAVDANRAFAGCVDLGVLRRTVERPLCAGPPGADAIRGPEGYACHALDDECVRGELTANACCSHEPRPDGIPCGGGGQCLAGTCVPHGFASPPDSAEPVLGVTGSEHWIDLTTRRTARFDYIEGGGVRVFVEDRPVAELPVPPDLSLDQVRVAPPTSGDAVGILARPGLHSLFVPFTQSRPICTVSGDPSDARVVWSDCTGRGVQVMCPGNVGDVQCTVEEGFAKITGPDLLMAWPLDPLPTDPVAQPPGDVVGSDGGLQLGIDANVGDIILPPPPLGDPIPPPSNADAGLPPGATPILHDLWTRLDLCTSIPGLRCVGSSDPQRQCSFGQARFCRLPDDSRSVELYGLTHWDPCLAPAEICNGIDDDHDGLVDEGLAAQQSCDDDLNCTNDLCVLGGSCIHRNTAPCKDTASCTTHTCSRVFAAPPLRPFPYVTTETDPSSPNCHVSFDNISCQDGCDCDGPEMCDPAHAPPHAGLFFDGCAPAAPPCNADNNLCTIDGCIPVPEQFDACAAAVGAQGGLPTYSSLAIRVLHRLDATSMEPWSPMDLGHEVECVIPGIITLGRRHVQTYGEVSCFDDDPCTNDTCAFTTGQCPHSLEPPHTACDPRPLSGSPLGPTSPIPCGPNFECTATGVCVDQTAGLPLDTVPSDCQSVAATVQCSRTSETLDNVHYAYTLAFGVAQTSCHMATCSANGDCGVALDFRACSASHGCIYDACTNDVGVQDSNHVLGCEERQLYAMCPVAPAGDCRERTAASCQSDGSCVLFPNNSNCSAPLGNECLVPTCRPDGHCQNLPNVGLCDFGCPGEQLPTNPRCNLLTGACESDGCQVFQ